MGPLTQALAMLEHYFIRFDHLLNGQQDRFDENESLREKIRNLETRNTEQNEEHLKNTNEVLSNELVILESEKKKIENEKDVEIKKLKEEISDLVQTIQQQYSELENSKMKNIAEQDQLQTQFSEEKGKIHDQLNSSFNLLNQITNQCVEILQKMDITKSEEDENVLNMLQQVFEKWKEENTK